MSSARRSSASMRRLIPQSISAGGHRATRGLIESEAATQKNLCTYLQWRHPDLWRVTFHVPNGIGAASYVQVARLRAMGFKAGVVDLVTLAPRGGFPFLALELKRAGQKPTKAQAEFIEACRAEGGRAEWADSFEAARAIFDSYAKAGQQ